MEDRKSDEYICLDMYILIRRQKYTKLHLFTDKCSSILMGKDKIELDTITGNRFGTSFKMIPVKGNRRHFTLNVCDREECVSLSMLMKDASSGVDNRNLLDDGRSQGLSADNITDLREQGKSPKEIMNLLLEHSATFHIKTEFAQEKYLKKKEGKYLEYITIERPSLRTICELFYNRELPKSINLRIDVISQIITGINLQPDGTYLLFENGFRGLVTAACLNYLDSGKLINITPGPHFQKQAVLAMNFDEEKMSHLLTVQLSTLLEHLHKRNEVDILGNDKNNTFCSENVMNTTLPTSSSQLQNNSGQASTLKIEFADTEVKEAASSTDIPSKENTTKDELLNLNCKRKHSCDAISQHDISKKPRWAVIAENAIDILTSQKVDGLIIACKEYPNNILLKFLQYVGLSRPFIVYSPYQEPLVQLYCELKKMKVIYLRITDCWLREYQVLPDRTHPSIIMSPGSGYLLSGIVVSDD